MALAAGADVASTDVATATIPVAEEVDEADAEAGVGTEEASPTIQVCSGLKFGGEHGPLLRKPSALRVRHEFPSPTPLLTALLAIGNPIPPARLWVELKKNCS